VPTAPIVTLLVNIQVFNGLLLPVVLGFIVVLGRDRRLMGSLANTRLQTTLGIATLVAVTASALLLLVLGLP
jgi:Mn2+/Fe2+ NRAMP family transporter